MVLLEVLGVKPDERLDDVDELRLTALPPTVRCEETTLPVWEPPFDLPVDVVPRFTDVPWSERPGVAVLPTVERVLLCPLISELWSLPLSLPKSWPLPYLPLLKPSRIPLNDEPRLLLPGSP